jgi:hypothetical protein
VFSAFGFWVFRVLGFRARRLVNNKTLALRSFLSMAACLFGYYLKSILTLETIGCRNVSLWSLMVASGQTWPENPRISPLFFQPCLTPDASRCYNPIRWHFLHFDWSQSRGVSAKNPWWLEDLEAVWFRSVEIRRVCRIGSRFWLFVWRLQRQQLKPSRASRANWSNGERLYQNHPVRNT